MSADQLPHDIEAEQCVLGAAMLSPDSAALAVESLKVGDFYRPSHQAVFEAIAGMVDRNADVDAVTVKAELERRKAATRNAPVDVVDPLTLHAMTELVPVASHIGSYIDRVRELSHCRNLIIGGTRLVALGRKTGLDREERADEARKLADQVTAVEETTSSRPVSDLIYPFLDRLESKDAPGLETGWQDMDALTSGLKPGQMVVVAGRPGMGKTVFLLNVATHAAITNGHRVLFASLEMTEDEIMARIVANQAKVSLHMLKTKDLTEWEWDRITRKAAQLGAADTLLIDDNPGITIPRLRDKLSAMRRSGRPAELVCLDYLQLMTSTRRTENRQQEVSGLSRSLKLLAKEFQVPIVVGSQLNRESQQRADKRPMLSDIRESGSVEQDADIVVLLHREDAYERESPRAGEIDLIVAKHRQGPTATITCAFQGHYSRIADMQPH